MKTNRRHPVVGAGGLGLVVALLLAGPGPLWAQEGAALAEGARVYGNVCGSCHNARSPLERSDRDWVTIINHMRVRANMTGEQVRDVLAFLQGTNQDPQVVYAPPTVPTQEVAVGESEAVEKGKQLVTAKACVGCHYIGNGGGNVGPRLNGVVQRKGEEFVRRKLADPTFDRQTSMMPNFGLSEEEIGWIVAYLSTLDGKE